LKRLIILTLAGLLLETLGFLTSNADELPLVERLIARDYVDGRAALERLAAGQALEPGEQGFTVVERIVMGHLREVPQNDPNVVENAELRRLSYSMGHQVIGVGQQKSFLGARLRVGDKTATLEDLDDQVVKDGVEALKERISFGWAPLLFVAGGAMQVVGLLLDMRDKGRTERPSMRP
jgi:hypothetical protein